MKDGDFRGPPRIRDREDGWLFQSWTLQGKEGKDGTCCREQVFYVDLIQILKLWNIDG
jgi:hypothetical protein